MMNTCVRHRISFSIQVRSSVTPFFYKRKVLLQDSQCIVDHPYTVEGSPHCSRSTDLSSRNGGGGVSRGYHVFPWCFSWEHPQTLGSSLQVFYIRLLCNFPFFQSKGNGRSGEWVPPCRITVLFRGVGYYGEYPLSLLSDSDRYGRYVL